MGLVGDTSYDKHKPPFSKSACVLYPRPSSSGKVRFRGCSPQIWGPGSVPTWFCTRHCLEASLKERVGGAQVSPFHRALPACNLGCRSALTQLKTNCGHIFTWSCQLSWVDQISEENKHFGNIGWSYSPAPSLSSQIPEVKEGGTS